jgi:hypothetical protein
MEDKIENYRSSYILGVSEVRWKGQGELRSGDYVVYRSEERRVGKECRP